MLLQLHHIQRNDGLETVKSFTEYCGGIGGVILTDLLKYGLVEILDDRLHITDKGMRVLDE